MSEGDRAIGLRGGLPWHLPADLAHFRRTTMGHTLIMGRVTYESLGGRRLEGRRLIVLTRTDFRAADEQVRTAESLDQALSLAEADFRESEVFIAGGAQVYARALERDLVDRMLLTLVHGTFEADAFFPAFKLDEWTVQERNFRPADEANPYSMTFLTLTLAARGG